MSIYKEFIDSFDFYQEGCINIMTFPSCPIKVGTTEAIKEFVEKYNNTHQKKIYYPMMENVEHRKLMDALEHVEDPSRYPDIVIQCDYNSLFAPNFKSFQESGLFVDVLKDYVPNVLYHTFDYKDPKETYTLLGASFPVIVVDKTILGDLPIPKSFFDLLNPIYEKKIAIHGHGTSHLDMSVVMNIQNLYGKEAVGIFAKAIQELRHFSQVVKDAGKGIVGIPAISVIPEMFQHMIKNKENVEIIWPLDGAPLFPLWMTVKKSVLPQAQELISFLTGEEMGQLWSKSFFASINPKVENYDYQEKPFNFMSWTDVYQDDFLESRRGIESEVLDVVRGFPLKEGEKLKKIC